MFITSLTLFRLSVEDFPGRPLPKQILRFLDTLTNPEDVDTVKKWIYKHVIRLTMSGETTEVKDFREDTPRAAH